MRLLLLSLACCAASGEAPPDFPREGDEAALLVGYELDEVLADATVEEVGVLAWGDEGFVHVRGAVGGSVMFLVPPGTWVLEGFVDAAEEEICVDDPTPVQVSADPYSTVEVHLTFAYVACLPGSEE